MLYDFAGLTSANQKDALANILVQFRQENITISQLKKKLDVYNKSLFYVLFFLDRFDKTFTHQDKWTDDETFSLIASVFREGEKWKSVSNSMFDSPDFADSCRQKYRRLTTNNILGIGEKKKEISALVDILEEVNRGNYSRIADKAAEYEDSFMDGIESSLSNNNCNSFVFAKITESFIKKDQSRKEKLLQQLSFKRSSVMMPYIQWCLALSVFQRIEIMHYVPNVPVGFFNVPFIDDELYARGDPQLMTKIKEQQKEIEKFTAQVYNPKIVLDKKSILVNEIPDNSDDANYIRKTKLLSILAKERNNWDDSEKEYVEKFSSLIYLISPKAAEIVSDHIGAYKKSKINAAMRNDIQFYKNVLTDVKQLKHIINNSYEQESVLYATLAGNAAVMSSDGENSENLYCLQVLPLDPKYKTTPVHFHIFPKGAAPRSLLNLFQESKNEIEATGKIKVIFFATDGETTTNAWHVEKFEKLIKNDLDQPFEVVVEKAMREFPWPVSDVLHLLKCARSHLLNHLICLFPSSMTCINFELMEKALDLGRVLSDKSKEGRMKDGYALSLFSWESFIKLYEETRNDGVYYLLPFTLLNEAIRAEYLKREERLQLLELAYLIFIDQYKSNIENKKNPIITERYSKAALGTTFADSIFLQRCINTVIGVAIALKLDQEDIGLERVGTHCLECFFGYMRMCAQGNNTSDRAIRSAIKSILIAQYSRDIDYLVHIQTRINTGGVKINAELEERLEHKPAIEIKPEEINKNLKQLAQQGECENRCAIEAFINSFQSRRIVFNSKAIRIPSYMSGYAAYARYKKSVAPVPDEKSPLNAFYKVSEHIKSKYTDIECEQREQLFTRWKELTCSTNPMRSVGHKQYAACHTPQKRTNFRTMNELFNFLFPTNHIDIFPVKSTAVSDDEFDEMPNNSNIDDLLENELLDDF